MANLFQFQTMTTYEYMLYQYKQNNINITDEYRDYKKNIHNLTTEELWFNNVSLDYPVPCEKCKNDLKKYNKLVLNHVIKELEIFDTPKSKLRKCSIKWCMWYYYFVSRRYKY